MVVELFARLAVLLWMAGRRFGFLGLRGSLLCVCCCRWSTRVGSSVKGRCAVQVGTVVGRKHRWRIRKLVGMVVVVVLCGVVE